MRAMLILRNTLARQQQQLGRVVDSWFAKDLTQVAQNLRRLEDNGADIREPRSPYLMYLARKIGTTNDWLNEGTH